MFVQALVVITWYARMFCRVGLQAATAETVPNGLSDVLNDVPLAVTECMLFKHHGAEAQFSPAVRNVFKCTFHNGWISRGGPTAWPPCSPVLNPLDFYVWGHLKPFAFSAPAHKVDTLHQHIVNACQTIHNYPFVFDRARRSMIRRDQAILSTSCKCVFSVLRKDAFAAPHLHELLFVCGAHHQSLSTYFRLTLYIRTYIHTYIQYIYMHIYT
jgi:hypothetical protein